MRLLTSPVAIWDIEDAENFVQAAIPRTMTLTTQQRADLVAEGLAILCELAAKYQPKMDGYSQEGRFSGYAAKLLRVRMSRAWHEMNEHHVMRTTPQGRKWCYVPEAESLDNLLDPHEDDHPPAIDWTRAVGPSGFIDINQAAA